MNELARMHGGQSEMFTRHARWTSRNLSRYQAETTTRIAAADAETDVTIGKLADLTAASGQAMAEMFRLAQLQKHFELQAPECSGFFASVTGLNAVAMNEELSNLQRSLRRI